jgi:hypothetical protein
VGRYVFAAFAALFACAAIYHALAIVLPTIDAASPAPAWRHALFFAINAAAAIGLVRRPRGFWAAFAILTAQQICSHGSAAFFAWRDERRVDYVSLAVIVAMLLVLALLVRDARSSSRSAPSQKTIHGP